MKNISVEKGLTNGSRLVYLGSAGKGKLRFRPFDKPNGNVLEMKRALLEFKKKGAKIQRCQFPIRSAWAITVHKSQGQTCRGGFGIYLPKGANLFAEGMAYTMLSRLQSLDQLRIFAPERNEVGDEKSEFMSSILEFVVVQQSDPFRKRSD